EIPVLLTAPLVEKSTKFAAVPNVGAWAKLKVGIKSIVNAINLMDSIVFILIEFNCEVIFTMQRCTGYNVKALHKGREHLHISLISKLIRETTSCPYTSLRFFPFFYNGK